MTTGTQRRSFFKRGLYIAAGLVFGIALAYFVRMGLAYDGTCGGFFPGVASPKTCSFAEYAWGDVLVIGLLMAITYWPLTFTALLAPPFVGYLLDQRAARSGS